MIGAIRIVVVQIVTVVVVIIVADIVVRQIVVSARTVVVIVVVDQVLIWILDANVLTEAGIAWRCDVLTRNVQIVVGCLLIV